MIFLFMTGSSVYGIPLVAVGIIVLAVVAGELCKKFGLAPVFGQILCGTLLVGAFPFIAGILNQPAIQVIANIGINLLMFKIGLETNPHDMFKVGFRSLVVAIIGVVLPFIFGAYIVGPLLFPSSPKLAHIFIGAALTATSVSIPVDILTSFGKASSRLGRTVTGAAVIDDILGIIILAVVKAAANTQTGEDLGLRAIIWVVVESVGFVVVSVWVGIKLHVLLGKMMARVSAQENMKIAFTLGICFGMAALAAKVGLAEFVGAYCAGLFLTQVAFQDFAIPRYTEEMEKVFVSTSVPNRNGFLELKTQMIEKHVEDILMGFVAILAPVFFVTSGMKLDLWVLFKKESLIAILVCSGLACLGKVAAGIAAEKGERLAVGVSMIPRGEVGLIFADIGQREGVMIPEIFSMVMGTILVTTLITPLILGQILRSPRFYKETV